MTWVDIKGYEGYYQITKCGKIRSLDRKIPNGKGRKGYRTMKSKVKSISKDPNGYPITSLNMLGRSKAVRIHTLLWENFIGDIPIDKVIDHIDGNTSNNDFTNLQLLSHRQNISKGEMVKRSKHSKYPNVSFRLDRKKFFGRLQINGRSVITGHYDNDIDAHESVLKYKEDNGIL